MEYGLNETKQTLFKVLIEHYYITLSRIIVFYMTDFIRKDLTYDQMI